MGEKNTEFLGESTQSPHNRPVQFGEGGGGGGGDAVRCCCGERTNARGRGERAASNSQEWKRRGLLLLLVRFCCRVQQPHKTFGAREEEERGGPPSFPCASGLAFWCTSPPPSPSRSFAATSALMRFGIPHLEEELGRGGGEGVWNLSLSRSDCLGSVAIACWCSSKRCHECLSFPKNVVL